MTFKFTYQPSKDLDEANKQITNLVELIKNEFLQMADLETTKQIEDKVEQESEKTGRNIAQVRTKTTKNSSHIAMMATFNDATGVISITSALVNGIESSTIQLKGDQIHLDGDTYIGSGFTLYGDNIASRTIKASHIKAAAITAYEIAGKTITAAEIATGTITANEIAGKTITAAEIATGTITANEIAAHTITAAEISTNYVYAGNISANQITSGYMSADRISAGDLDLGSNTLSLGNGITLNSIHYGTGYALLVGGGLVAGATSVSALYINNISTTSVSANLAISGGKVYETSESSRRYKHDIKPIEDKELSPEKLYDIPVVQFVYNEDYLSKEDPRSKKPIPGFIAEDIDEVYPIACDKSIDGKPNNWNARYIVPPMLKLIQDQHKEIEQLKKQLASQSEKLLSLEQRLQKLEEAQNG